VISGMTATLAYGYILSHDHTGEWDTVKPAYNEETFEMDWPDWVDPEDPVDSLSDRLFAGRTGFKYYKYMSDYANRPDDYWDEYREAAAAFPAKAAIEVFGYHGWPEQDVVLYATESKREAMDTATVLEDLVWASTAWGGDIYDALITLDIEPTNRGPQWLLIPSAS
jgi:hypothetical protein